jgi:heat shock protein HtpX
MQNTGKENLGLNQSPDSQDELRPLPNLFFHSWSVLFGMYAVLTLVLITLVEFYNIPASFALIAGLAITVIQFAFGPLIMDIMLRLLYKTRWIHPIELPEHLRNFIEETCRAQNIPFPRIGLIGDGSPNAFTYGHHPGNARIVFSRGLLNLLDENEVEAVAAHEIGHVIHWDMLVMTVAQIVPLVLYYIYRTITRISDRGRDSFAQYGFLVTVFAYVLYVLSEFIVLWLSRIRELYADRFAAEITGDPNYLASALVKIGYGMAQYKPEETPEESKKKKKKKEEKQNRLAPAAALGIFNPKASISMAIGSHTNENQTVQTIDREALANAVKWDLHSPWAKFYELQSTHPLIANRLGFLANQSIVMNKEPFINFGVEKTEPFVGRFLLELFVGCLPYIVIAASAIYIYLTNNFEMVGVGLLLTGLAYMLKIRFSYPAIKEDQFLLRDLIGSTKVSGVRSIPCIVKGKLIGRGVPGLIYSEDFVLQDETGIMFLDYRQPLNILNFLFGLLKAGEYINREVSVMGWYRRSPIPYIEVRRIIADNKTATCYTYNAKLAITFIAIVSGAAAIILPDLPAAIIDFILGFF